MKTQSNSILKKKTVNLFLHGFLSNIGFPNKPLNLWTSSETDPRVSSIPAAALFYKVALSRRHWIFAR